jgi:hypothetical protein
MSNIYNIKSRLEEVRHHIHDAEQRFGRVPGSVKLIAVSKTFSARVIRMAVEAGQRAFGESYLQEALQKIDSLKGLDLEWHFIGPVQSNKTTQIATHFDWVHGIDREKIAQRLNDARNTGMPPLNACIQVNISGEESKSGICPEDLPPLVESVKAMPQLVLRGLMAIPAPCDSFTEQRKSFEKLYDALECLNQSGMSLDTLSMGMSDDMDAAIAEGATMIRIGSAIFGDRNKSLT